eukprot:CAMPEP_0176296948 /NCGR_PEP_ID=MMETSP0121_2-20121125/58464_1 /TAXON_ID=160619 /ORGANISM="Kryptoperidinium foliaceum, Strain CCMP 1326" /LENGTH=162 /DNA_ID=CAMNT_0017638111 /DNA_START=63 /DNA_END=550 /DNA_ORIENTATION=+
MAGSSPCGVTPSGRSDLVSTPSSPMAWGGGSLDQVLSRSVAALQALQFVDEKTKDTGGEGTTSDLRRAIHDRRREQIDIAWEAVCKKYSLPADGGGGAASERRPAWQAHGGAAAAEGGRRRGWGARPPPPLASAAAPLRAARAVSPWVCPGVSATPVVDRGE